MEFPLTLIDLAGCVALLLWGVHMVQTGVQRTFGARLRSVLGRALRNRLSAFLTGIGVTAVLQSSTATGLMVTGFAAGGMVELVPALAVMLGANVGTTLIVQVLSFNVSAISPALVLVGVMMFRKGGPVTRDPGRVLIGLGLMLMALHQLLDVITPYEDTPNLRVLLGAISTEPFLDVILAAAFTWAAHSSVAVVLLIMSLAAKGAIPPHAAYALVLGANLGTAINPILEGGAGEDPATRRLPMGNLLTRLAGVAIGLALLPRVGILMAMDEPNVSRGVADFHTAFNVVTAVVFLPLLPWYAKLLRRMLPARIDPADPSRPQYLDQSALETPLVALGCATREALRLADMLEVMLQAARDTLGRPDRRPAGAAKRLDDVLDKLNTAIKAYLGGIETDALSEDDETRLSDILGFGTHIEYAGGIVEKGVLARLGKLAKRGVLLPPEARSELLAMIDRLSANLRTAITLFMAEDVRVARALASEKEVFRDAEATATVAHFARLRDRRTDEETSHLDMLRDLKRVNTHLVAAAAYPVLERAGELLPSRMRSEG